MTPLQDLLTEIEHYYDEVPRALATAEDHGPFTLFLRKDPAGWPYYARPRLAHPGPVTLDDVRRVQDRQHEAGAPEAFEWVEETTSGLGPVLRAAGLEVHEHPLMVLRESLKVPPPDDVEVRVLGPDDSDDLLAGTTSAVDSGFGETDDLKEPGSVAALRDRLSRGLMRLVGAFDATGPMGGGSHGPRGTVSELAGIAVLPRARRRGVGAAVTAALVDDALRLGVRTVFLSAGSPQVAEVYARVGFSRIGTACVAEPPGDD
jgi:GNAT superfamily N-acetyltransferase